MTRRLLIGFLVLCSLAAAPAAFAEATVVEVIPLQYRAPDEVMPVIERMVGPGGSVSGFQGQLIVRATPANLADIRRVLASIDTRPRRLLITVRQEAYAERRRSEADFSGNVGNGRVRVIAPGSGEGGGNVVIRGGDDELRARVREVAGEGRERGYQSVQVLEGRSAFIAVGESRPMPAREVRRTIVGGQVVEQVVDTFDYRDAATGFYVRPRVAGGRVTLEVNPQRERFRGPAPGSVSVQRAATTVSGRIGEWIEVGGISEDSSARGTVLLGSERRAAAKRHSVLIRVEELP